MTPPVHRKAKGRGWVFRWKEVAGGKVVRRTSPEYGTRRLAEQARDAAATHLDQVAHVRRQRQSGLLMPWKAVLDRWRLSRRADEQVTQAYADEVHKVLLALATGQGWATTADITAAAVDAWRAKGPGKRSLSYLKAVLRYARRVLRQPVDDEVLALPVGASRADPPPLLTDAQVAQAIASARLKGDRFALLLDCLATYGWRPIEACRCTVADWNPSTGEITRRRTKNGATIIHEVLPRHRAALDALTEGRPADAPLFTSPRDRAWTIGKQGSATELAVWYRRQAADHLPTADRGIYRLKDYAISRMDALGIDDRTKAGFTGHEDLRSFDHYKATNRARAKSALARMDGGTNGGTPATGAEVGAS